MEALAGKALSEEALAGKALSEEALSAEALAGEGLSTEALTGEAQSAKALSEGVLSEEAPSEETLSTEALSEDTDLCKVLTGFMLLYTLNCPLHLSHWFLLLSYPLQPRLVKYQLLLGRKTPTYKQTNPSKHRPICMQVWRNNV